MRRKELKNINKRNQEKNYYYYNYYYRMNNEKINSIKE